MMLSQPMPMTSVTSFITVAPSAMAFWVAAAMSSTETLASQNEGEPGIYCCIRTPPMPLPTWIMV